MEKKREIVPCMEWSLFLFHVFHDFFGKRTDCSDIPCQFHDIPYKSNKNGKKKEENP